MPELGSYGSVRGAAGNSRPYRERRQRQDAPQAQLAGVQKAPRHEVAGSWAPAKQRALSGFYAGAALDGKRDASTRRRAMSA